MNYLELISQNQDEARKEDLQFVAEEAQHAVSIALLETRKAISNAKKGLKEARKAQPYNLRTVVDFTIKIENLQAGLKIAKAVQKEDFS